MAALIFYLSFFVIFYVYVIYPVAIYFLSFFIKNKSYSLLDYDVLPELTIVIPLYNESALIRKKMDDFQLINYPIDKIKYIFVSDGSTDASNSVLSILESEDPHVSVIYVDERKGKPNALNMAMEKVETDVVVFSDIRQTISPDSIINMVSQLLSDESIGVVCGELVHLNHEGATSENVGVYWKYEKWIRHSESDFYSTVGTTGALYVLYRKDFSKISINTILDDFEIPMNILRNGKLLKISKNSFIYDVAHENINDEKTRKIRTLSGNYQSFMRMKWLFSPFENPVFIQFISHKFLRLVVPYLMFFILISNLFLIWDSIFYLIIFLLQLAFYGIVFMAKYFSWFRRNKLFNFCLVFFELNIAAVYGLYRFIKNEASVTWNKT